MAAQMVEAAGGFRIPNSPADWGGTRIEAAERGAPPAGRLETRSALVVGARKEP